MFLRNKHFKNFILLDFQSSSPPKKDSISVYTPSSGQKRFNPFMKETMGKKNQDVSSDLMLHKSNTPSIHKKPLTPTKDHPLMDLEQFSKNKFMDDSDEEKDDGVANEIQLDDLSADALSSGERIINEVNNILPETKNYQSTINNPDDETNNNKQIEAVNDDYGKDKRCSAPETVLKRRKSPSRLNNNNHSNIKNNNRTTFSCDQSQSRIANELLKPTTDKLEGE